MGSQEHRRAPRLKTRLLVQVTGVDPEPCERFGDLSLTGIYVQMDRDVGPVGSLQRLVVGTPDGILGVTLLARVVRVASVEDLWQGRTVAGVAFQFVTDGLGGSGSSPPGLADLSAVEDLLRELLQGADEDSVLAIEHRFDAELAVPNGANEATRLEGLGVSQMVLHIDRPLPRDEVVRVQIPQHEGKPPLTFVGTVGTCEPKTGDVGGFRVRVDFGANVASSRERPQDETLQALFGAVVSVPPSSRPSAPPKQLGGELSRVGITSVLTLCQLDRISGVLRLRRGDAEVHVFLRHGEVLDAEHLGQPQREPRAVIGELLHWSEGAFEVRFGDLVREPRIHVSTTALLMDLVREMDEAGR